MVSNPVIHVIARITTHLPTPKGWKAELARLVNPQRTPYPRSGHMSTIDQAEKVCQPKTNIVKSFTTHQSLLQQALWNLQVSIYEYTAVNMEHGFAVELESFSPLKIMY